MQLQIEKYIDGVWWLAATLHIDQPAKGLASSCTLEYLPDYVLEHLDCGDEASLDFQHPLSFNHYRCDGWPAFFLDLLPSGYGRDTLLTLLNGSARDGTQYDASVLMHGASQPPGCMRIREAHQYLADAMPQGFGGWSEAELAEVGTGFESLLQEHDVLHGVTCMLGQAPKLWMSRARDGLFYPDACLAEADIVERFLVKFPRNREEQVLLEHEFVWLKLAKTAGLDVHGQPFMLGSLLFIPRFDCALVQGQWQRHHLMSMYTLQDAQQHGLKLFHEDVLTNWQTHAEPEEFLLQVAEYLRRDVLSYCLKAEDNHGRNTAFLRHGSRLQLSPLFDFSPMFLTCDPPTRLTTWRSVTVGQHQQWPLLFEAFLPALLGEAACHTLRASIRDWCSTLAEVQQQFAVLKLDERTDACHTRFATALAALNSL